MHTMAQRLSAEFLGTFALVFFSAGAICADQFMHNPAGGGLLGIALAQGLAVAVLYTALARMSGGHFNPAVSIGFWVTKRFSTLEVAAYWLAQLVGATAAAFLLKAILLDDAWRPVALGTPDLARDFSRLPAMSMEAIVTFFLMLVFLGVSAPADGEPRPAAGFAVGLTYSIGILVASPFTGAALSPAREFGPALAASHWANWGVYWVGPLAGAFAGGLIYDALFAKKI
jgi:glycerol uptake facilitator protein